MLTSYPTLSKLLPPHLLLPSDQSLSHPCHLFCDPLSLTRAVCVTIGFEVFVGAWWGHTLMHSWGRWLPFSQNLSMTNGSAGYGEPELVTPLHSWVAGETDFYGPRNSCLAIVSLCLPWTYPAYKILIMNFFKKTYRHLAGKYFKMKLHFSVLIIYNIQL